MRSANYTGTALPFALLLGLTAGAGAATAQTAVVGAEAYAVYAKTATVEQPRSPHAALTNGAVMAYDAAPGVSVPNLVRIEHPAATATGAGDRHDASAQSITTLERVNLLDGLVTADFLVAAASSALHGDRAHSNGDGTTFGNLSVQGVALPAEVAPNTRIALPGVGFVLLNERIPAGDGTTSTGLTVRMIRLVLHDAAGAPTGEIIVGAASSYVRQ